jgi:hypothetical protein
MLKPRTQPPAETPEEPTLESVSPEYAEMSRLFQELIAREERIGAEMGPLIQTVNKSGLARFNEQNALNRARVAEDAEKPVRMIAPSRGTAELLGEFAPKPVPALTPLEHEPEIVKKLNKLSDDLRDTRNAIALLGAQMTRKHFEASSQFCDQIRPQYQKIAKRIVAALLELGRAEIEQREFLRKNRRAGLSTLRVVHGTGSLGDPLDHQSELRRQLFWAAECQHFSLSDLPADWPGPRDTAGIRSWPIT